MAASLKTANYDLAIYAANDITSYLVDFNGNMNKIDAQMKANSNSISGLGGEIARLQQDVTAAEQGLTSLQQDVTQLKTDVVTSAISLQPTSNANSLVSRLFRIIDISSGFVNCIINKTGAELSTIEISGVSDRKFVPIANASGNPFNLSTVTSPGLSDLSVIGIFIDFTTNNSESDMIYGSLVTYFNGVNTLIGSVLLNTSLTSNVNFKTKLAVITERG